ncbi:hypothetical protein Acr_00g0056490 [Actinidia rufa]|uniref:Uncharacterized protein n=1 Tax=Actinidia rufa TaxID=165716 RepID=A0A7J0DM86_9ERIC|nr:hypothetical protein Acr_00g0056490 [Actinidia rufa]
MTQGNLDRLRETCSFPLGVRMRIPGNDEMILTADNGDVAFYEAAFSAGLRCLYNLLKGPRLESGWLHFKARLGKNILKGPPTNVKGCKKRFFFISGDNWEFHLSIPHEEGAIRVPRSWGASREGGHFKIPVVLDSRLESFSDSGISLELRSDGIVLKTRHSFYFIRGLTSVLSATMSSWISLSTLTKKAGEKKVATKERSSVATSQQPLEGDRHSRKTTSGGRPQPRRKEGALVAQKILNGVILPADKEKVDQFTTDELVTKSFHALGQAVVLISALALRSQDHQNNYHFQLDRTNFAELEMAMKIEAELKDKSEAMARLEAEVAELTSKLALAKKLAIEEFKSSDDFKDAVIDSAAMYFSEGFEFYKRQLLH